MGTTTPGQPAPDAPAGASGSSAAAAAYGATAALADPAGPETDGRLIVSPIGTVALLDEHGSDGVRFEGVAVGTGTFTDVAGRSVRITGGHLALIAQRLAGVFIRDLHQEEIGATVGVVDAGHAEGDEVHFTGDVPVRPFTEVVRAPSSLVWFSRESSAAIPQARGASARRGPHRNLTIELTRRAKRGPVQRFVSRRSGAYSILPVHRFHVVFACC